uniref:PsbQ-like protein 3, chloroplastic n=1 Tax=Salix viminalis TaxID=40686 RepID=A0A6N2MAI7_SALVM
MASRTLVSIQNVPHNSPIFTCCLKPTFQSKGSMPHKVMGSDISRRIGAIAAVTAIVLVKEAMFSQDIANGQEFRFATPDQRSVEEAESGARDYAQSLLQLKDLLESQSWKEAQKLLRRRSSNLKLDLYAVIESKPGKDRPQLRTLYSNLFNNVAKLDYAVRDRDVSIVWQCYENIVATYDLILSRI